MYHTVTAEQNCEFSGFIIAIKRLVIYAGISEKYFSKLVIEWTFKQNMKFFFGTISTEGTKSLTKPSYLPVSIRNGATPDLNFANADLCD